MQFTHVTSDLRQIASVPCIRGLRILVATIVAMTADGVSEAEIVSAFRIWTLTTFMRRFDMYRGAS